MEVIPAIDLRGGRCVRLRQGDYAQETVFGDDPAAMAERWASEGATRLHLVDLDGARDGRPGNVEAVRAILARLGGSIPVQLGGGVRDEAIADSWLDAGVERVIVGTRAAEDPEWFERFVAERPGRVVLGLDARDGNVATGGWLAESGQEARTLAERFDRLPLAAVVYTEIARDGMLEGPDVGSTVALAEALKTPVIASGGVSSLEDLERLAGSPVAGCIVGRALYDGRFRLDDAIKRAGTRPAAPGRP